jgi:hypothetical protein
LKADVVDSSAETHAAGAEPNQERSQIIHSMVYLPLKQLQTQYPGMTQMMPMNSTMLVAVVGNVDG